MAGGGSGTGADRQREVTTASGTAGGPPSANIQSWGGFQWVGTRRIFPSQAQGSVFTVLDFSCGAAATGAGTGESCLGSGTGSALGAGAGAAGMGCGCTGVRTTAGWVTGCRRTGAAAAAIGCLSTSGCRIATGWGAGSGNGAGAGGWAGAG